MLVHGAGLQVERLAASKLTPSNIDGTGVTDAATLDLALTAANRVTHDVLTGLTGVDIRAAASNAVVAHPAGILQGVDLNSPVGSIASISACCNRSWSGTSCRSCRRWVGMGKGTLID